MANVDSYIHLLNYVNFTLHFHLPFAGVWSNTVAPPSEGNGNKWSWWIVIQNLFYHRRRCFERRLSSLRTRSRTGINLSLETTPLYSNPIRARYPPRVRQQSSFLVSLLRQGESDSCFVELFLSRLFLYWRNDEMSNFLNAGISKSVNPSTEPEGRLLLIICLLNPSFLRIKYEWETIGMWKDLLCCTHSQHGLTGSKIERALLLGHSTLSFSLSLSPCSSKSKFVIKLVGTGLQTWS